MNTATDETKRIPVTGKDRGGEWVRFGLEEYRVPPLGFKGLRELQSKIESLRGMTTIPTDDQMGVVSEVLHAALQRNYPEVTLAEVEEMLDTSNFQQALTAVMNVPGMRRLEPGEARQPSESTGMASTSF